MTELIRDTVFGHIVRFASGGKLLQYQEERDPSLWKQFVDKEKSDNAAHHGTVEPHRTDTRPEEHDHSPDSERTEIPDDGHTYNEVTMTKVDTEKGKDIHVVSWYGKDDPENPQNWSQFKKFFVTFELCLLTFGVYIGSAIYTAGIEDVTRVFGVSQVAATLGLTLFVAGYGLGPMIWSPMSEIPQIGRNPIYIGTLVIVSSLPISTEYLFLTAIVRRFSSTYRAIGQLRHAPRISIPDRLFRLARSSDWRCQYWRHLRS